MTIQKRGAKKNYVRQYTLIVTVGWDETVFFVYLTTPRALSFRNHGDGRMITIVQKYKKNYPNWSPGALDGRTNQTKRRRSR